MGLFSWFGKSAAPDYETLLSRLASDVHDAKVHLSEIRLRQRRFALLINLYGIALWGVWAGLWWIGGLPFGLIGWNARGGEARAVGAAGVLLGPVFIYFLGRLHSLYFARQRRYEETHLRTLLAEQKKQVDAIKKATNYDATRKLIEEYDVSNGFGSSTPGQAGSGPQTPQAQNAQSRAGSKAGTPQKGSPIQNKGPQTPRGQTMGQGGKPNGVGVQGTPRAPGHLTPMPAGMSAEQAAMLHLQPQPVLPTPEKRWYDRVVDSILGEDPSHATQSKFALVCGECFRHNGLIGTKYEWERMQWICPRCNHLNPAPLSRAPLPNAEPASTPIQPNRSLGGNPMAPSPGTPSRAGPGSSSAQASGLGGSAANATGHGPQTRARRQLSGMSEAGGTPRGSRLRQQVVVDDEEEEDEDKEETGERSMEVDE